MVFFSILEMYNIFVALRCKFSSSFFSMFAIVCVTLLEEVRVKSVNHIKRELLLFAKVIFELSEWLQSIAEKIERILMNIDEKNVNQYFY